jgi:transposase-like protein
MIIVITLNTCTSIYVITKVITQNVTKMIDERQILGCAIISKGDIPKKIRRNVYLVPSQSEPNRKYSVTLHGTKWSCPCKDHVNTNANCKHICAVVFWLKVYRQMEAELDNKEPIEGCPYCGGKEHVKNGHIMSSGRNRYLCKSCRRTFVADKDFKKFKGSGQIITACLDLYFKGVSLRKIKDHLKQFYDLEVNHSTIYRWIRKFTKMLSSYTNTLEPQTGEIWHADEQMIKSKGRHVWTWNVIDRDSRFLLTSLITETREIRDARRVFAKAKEATTFQPSVIITDGLQSYRQSIKKEFHTHRTGIKHFRYETLQTKPNNNMIERFHNTFRERDKVIRGFNNDKTAQVWVNGFRMYYNFVRPHMALGTTPAFMSGIDLNLQQNRWLGLIKQASTNMQQEG